MTKTELTKILENGTKRYTTEERLNKCSAWVYEIVYNERTYICLQSYSTRVALYDFADNCVYVNDYYSATTVQHVYKFANGEYLGRFNESNIPVKKLYIHSQMRKAEKEKAIATDFACI